MKNMHVITFLLVSILLMGISLADNSLELEKVGYGITPQNIIIIYKNVGTTTLTNLDVYVDGQKIKTIDTKLSPQKNLEDNIFLLPGTHKIRVESGQYSDEITVISVKEVDNGRVSSGIIPEKSFFERFKWFLIITIFFIIIILLTLFVF